jgi:hypothetical protein
MDVKVVHMVSSCPKCGRNVPDDAIYCPYCAHGLKATALTSNVSAAGVLMLVGTVGFLVVFLLATAALLQIYSWYPILIAQKWFVYDQILTGLCLAGFLFGLAAATLVFARKSHRSAVTLAVLCTLSGAGVWTLSMIIPEYKPLYSILYYFLPDFVAPLSATLLILRRKSEFK